jgi:hypothetical protein
MNIPEAWGDGPRAASEAIHNQERTGTISLYMNTIRTAISYPLIAYIRVSTQQRHPFRDGAPGFNLRDEIARA